MILKEKDSITLRLQQLEQIQKLTYLSEVQRAEVEKKLKILKAGDTGEQDSAYFINFDYQDSQNYVVIHDLRIEYGGFFAQIDHLLINRFLHFFILETKYFSQGIKITHQGEFLRWQNNRYRVYPSYE
jgi:hypothetical protein